MISPSTKTVEQLEQELEQALTRAEAAEADLREANRRLGLAAQIRLNMADTVVDALLSSDQIDQVVR